MLHEYVTHFGLRQTLGEAQFNDFMDLVFEEHADEITGSPLAESYGFDPDAEMPENARLTKQRELAEEWLARKAEEIAPLLRRGIENAEVGRWRKFIGRIRQFLAEHRLLPKSYLDRLDDRTLTDLLRRTLGNAGYEFDAVREGEAGATDVSGRAAVRSEIVGRKLGDVLDEIEVDPNEEVVPLLPLPKYPSEQIKDALIAKMMKEMPESVRDADGYLVLLRYPDFQKDKSKYTNPLERRFNHLLTYPGRTVPNIEKIRWSTRIIPTIQNFDVVVHLDGDETFEIYVKKYKEGWHTVWCDGESHYLDQYGFDYGLVSQVHEVERDIKNRRFEMTISRQRKPSNATVAAPGPGTLPSDQSEGAPSPLGHDNTVHPQSGLSSPAGKKNQKNSGMPSVDPAAHLDPTLEDNMIEALLLPVKKANGELSSLLDGGALKYLIDNGFPDVGNVTARYLTMEAKARLDEIKRKQSRAAAFQNYRDMDPLFDFIVEFAGGGENVIVNPGALQTVFHKKTRFFICFITKFLICFAFLSQNYRIFVAFYHEYIYFFFFFDLKTGFCKWTGDGIY